MRTYITIVTSLILHMLIYIGLVVWEQWAGQLTLQEKIALQDLLKQKEEHVDIVLLEKSPHAADASDSKAAFLAAQTQRVKNQTRARFMGLTQNREFPNRPSMPQREEAAQHEAVTSQQGTVSISATDRLNRELAKGISTISESLPDSIKHGDFTSLNTDQYLFFSFFSRIAPRIRFHWENGVERTVEALTFRNFSLREEKTFVTEVEVRLDSQGYYRGISIYRSSGIPGLDEAVARAFELSTPFINPPQEMVKDDNLIHLYYSFRVYFSPQLFARPAGH